MAAQLGAAAPFAPAPPAPIFDRMGFKLRPPPGLEDSLPGGVPEEDYGCCSTREGSDVSTSPSDSALGFYVPGQILQRSLAPGAPFHPAPPTPVFDRMGFKLGPPPGLEGSLLLGVREEDYGCCSTHEGSEVSTSPRDHEFDICVPDRVSNQQAEGRREFSTLDGGADGGHPGLPSVGSAAHHLGLCQPCDFLHRSREACRAGAACNYCHLCGPDENKRRKQFKRQLMKAARQHQRATR